MNALKIKLMLVLLMSIGLIAPSQADHLPPLDKEALVGAKMPKFMLPTFENKFLTNETFKGKRVILNIWASWCPPCRREMPALNTLHSKLQQQGDTVLGISADTDLYMAMKYLANAGIDFPTLLNGYNYVESLGVSVYPTTFVIDANGHIEQVYEGEQDWLNMPELLAN